MKNNRLLNDNKGFSLVELIVTVLITAILMIAVIAFISSSRTVYQSVNTSATLQEEAITAERVFTEAFMEAKVYKLETGLSTTADVIWIQSKENEPVSGDTNTDDSVYCFVIDKAANEIRYYKGVHKASDMISGGSLTTTARTTLNTECFGTNAKYCVVSKYVKSVNISTVPRSDGTDLVCIEIIFEYTGKEYTENITVVTRNLTHAPTVTATPSPATPSPSTGP